MPLVNLYFSPALLLLLLSCPLWQLSQSVPLTRTGPMSDSCVFFARTLLHNITDTLAQKNLFSGINCTQESVELNTESNTAFVCAPMESTCSGMVKSEFDEGLCLAHIKKDLDYYYRFLAAQPAPGNSLSQSVLITLGDLMQNCFGWALPTDMASVEGAADRISTYNDRLRLCKVLKGFQVRTITINRIIAYMKSDNDTN